MKRLLVAVVSLGLAALLILGGVSAAKASPSYDQEVTETAKLYKGAPFKWGGTTQKDLMHQGLPHIYSKQQ
jgi:murein DD-endopeptidase